MSEPRDEAVARLALARGFVDAARLAEARREQAMLRQAGLPADLLEALGSALTPAQLAELRGVAAGAAPALQATLTGAPRPAPASPAPGGRSTARAGQEVLRPGQVVGPYVIEEELGRGGMGVVYRARHGELGRRVALKLCLNAGARHVQRFVREAQATARLRHPNVVGVHEAGEADGRPWLAMELVEGAESLEQRLERAGPLGPEEAAGVAAAVSRALEHAHARGILHRDLKPSNLLLKDGVPLLCDFGLAKVVTGAESLTRTGELLGTPGYMAPEQVTGRDVDARADVWALGATLFALLAGQPPFKDDSLLATLARVMQARYPPLREVRPDVPDALEAIVRRCLERAPERRYPTCGALADDLERFLRGERPDALARARARRRRRLAGALLLALAVGLPAALALGPWAAPGPTSSGLAPGTPSPRADRPRQDEPPPDARDEPPPLPPQEGLPPGPGRVRTFRALLAWLARHPEGAARADALRAVRALRSEPLAVTRLEALCRPGGIVWATALDAERLLVHGTLSPAVELLGLDGAQRRWAADEPAGVRALAVAPSGAAFVFGDERGALHRAELGAAPVQRLWTLEPGAGSYGTWVRCAAFAPDGGAVAVGGDWPEVQLLSADGAPLRRFGPHGDSVLRLAFTPDGARLVTITGRVFLDLPRDDNALRVFDVARGTLLRELPCPGRPSSLAVSPDGRAALVGTRSGSLHLYDLETGAEAPSPRVEDIEQDAFARPRAHGGIVIGVAFAPGDPRRAYSASSDGDHDRRELRVWTVSPGGLELLRTERPTSPIDAVAVTPDGTCLVLGGSENVSVWGAGAEEAAPGRQVDRGQ